MWQAISNRPCSAALKAYQRAQECEEEEELEQETAEESLVSTLSDLRIEEKQDAGLGRRRVYAAVQAGRILQQLVGPMESARVLHVMGCHFT
jgi:hypothetical protein